jgi:hypothetical protein
MSAHGPGASEKISLGARTHFQYDLRRQLRTGAWAPRFKSGSGRWIPVFALAVTRAPHGFRTLMRTATEPHWMMAHDRKHFVAERQPREPTDAWVA